MNNLTYSNSHYHLKNMGKPKSYVYWFSVILVIIYVLYLLIKTTKIANAHFVFHSAFYYKTSKLYSPNSMIILLNAKKELDTIPFQCKSKNLTSTLTSKALIRAAEHGALCRWMTYIINCTTVTNPEYFGLTINDKKNFVGINFEYPEEKKFPVVMCYPQMVYESRWQQIIFATEIYHYFGADLQIQYINSAMTEIIDILEIYEKKGWIKIEKFAYIDFNPTFLSDIGYPPMLELDSRNQPMAYTNCLMKYRESSDFVIVADVDDILIPIQQPNFYNEFSYWSKMYPKAPAFSYFRSNGEIKVANSFDTFSLSDTFASLTVENKTMHGKTVYQTKNNEVAWVHWPYFNNESTVVIQPEEGKIFHVHVKNVSLPKKINFIPDEQLKTMVSEFERTFKEFPTFTSSSNIYADAITKCYDEMFNWLKTFKVESKEERKPCLSPLNCLKNIHFVKGFKCKVAKRNFTANYLNDAVVLHVPNSDYYWWKNDNGCKVFLY